MRTYSAYYCSITHVVALLVAHLNSCRASLICPLFSASRYFVKQNDTWFGTQEDTFSLAFGAAYDGIHPISYGFALSRKSQTAYNSACSLLKCRRKKNRCQIPNRLSFCHVKKKDTYMLKMFAYIFVVGFSFLSFPAKSNISRVNGAITYIGHDFKIYAGNCRLCVENVFDTMKWHKNMPSQAFKWEYFRSTCWTLIGNSNGKSGIDHENNISQWCILYK